MKCKKHPKYQAKRKPRHTLKYPNGCPQCWKMWHHVNDVVSAVVKQITDLKLDIMKPWEEIAPGVYTCNYGKTYDFE